MADLLLFGCLADARRARPRCSRLFNAHLDKYLSESDVKSRFHFGRDSINCVVALQDAMFSVIIVNSREVKFGFLFLFSTLFPVSSSESMFTQIQKISSFTPFTVL